MPPAIHIALELLGCVFLFWLFSGRPRPKSRTVIPFYEREPQPN